MLSVFLPLLVLPATLASYDEFFFLQNLTDTSTFCPGDASVNCIGPDNVCAHDSIRDKWYCCSVDDYPICRTGPTTCEGGDDEPSSGQEACTKEGVDWCCLQGVESCTQRGRQVRVCVATAENPLANLTDEQLGAKFSSLTSASPSSTSITFDGFALASSAASTSTSESTSEATPTDSSDNASESESDETDNSHNSDDSSLGGGAIAGIVIGAVAGVVIGAGLGFWLQRRRKSKKQWGQPPASEAAHYASSSDKDGRYDLVDTRDPNDPNELPADERGWRAEMGDDNGAVKEMPAQGPPVELPGNETERYR